jgi:anti-sigma factor (TIGR02949 family)
VSAPLDCQEAFAHLDDYVDRELSAGELAAVEEHLTRCAMCAEEFDVERALLDTIREKLRRTRVPPDLLGRILARLPG